MLSTIGGVLGLGIGAAILKMAPSLLPQGLLPSAVTLSFDWRVVAFCAAAALFAGLLFGLAPAWQISRFSSAQVIASGSRTVTGSGGRIRELLVIGEVATAVILLFGAGLLLRTLLALENVDRGYGARSVLTMVVDPLGSQYPTEASVLQFYQAIEQEVIALPGVRSMAWTSTLPLGPSYTGRSFFEIIGSPPADESQWPAANYQIVSPTYFRTVDLPVVAGRSFNRHDTRSSVLVCTVNDVFVRKYFHGRSPIGLRIAVRATESAQAPAVVRKIVGVARR